MKRPTIADELTQKRALEILWPKVIAYEGPRYLESDRPQLEESFMAALSAYHLGHTMTDQLVDDFGWAVDRRLVDLMDQAVIALYRAQKELMWQWAVIYCSTPRWKIGDRVMTPFRKRVNELGTVIEICEDEARYRVSYPDQKVASVYLVDFEDATGY